MPPKFDSHGSDVDGLERKYYDSLSELEQRVCEIARDHLKSSFDLTRSSGYLAWKKNT
jgi:hypothetical protein